MADAAFAAMRQAYLTNARELGLAVIGDLKHDDSPSWRLWQRAWSRSAEGCAVACEELGQRVTGRSVAPDCADACRHVGVVVPA